MIKPLLEGLEAADEPAVRECWEAYAETSIQVTLMLRLAGRDMTLLRTEASEKATVLEVDGHQQGEGLDTVLPPSSHATH